MNIFYNLDVWLFYFVFLMSCDCLYTTFTIFSMKYLVMCKVYTDIGGTRIK